MTKQEVERTAILVAGAVILALTGAAFWLSYAHLAAVAKTNGLAQSTARTWAWPATLDLFIVAGEVLMFRAALRRVTDWWAVGLTVAGSLGSIGLNVAGVGSGQPFLHYVVAAVPPSAALLAFGALMRQVHQLIDPASEPTLAAGIEEPEPIPTPEVSLEREPDAAPPAAELPAADPAPVPPALLDYARKTADAHRESTGRPIDADTLRARLGVPGPLAASLVAQLT
ncbi:DUF2637 domain-containing protein [Streptomyces fuscigenes]|uniref:DUF2637 domain-containing protein n=1 Tax=Streptomyces fuscigenes TaxID=1528880 RepID=UPI001F325CF9|nr:DUF2637 domain-containing protein [Streptomyces fuscigenes]MCF3960390.1 DUF2637 domain-containing protein [Streptomyces fuscigenes]